MCKKALGLHGAKKKAAVKSKPVKKASPKLIKLNDAEKFFLNNEDVLN
jgi:hypothetical protein